ncbi:nitrogen fixation regulation protein fixK [Asticcacaulis biprosthecium C19]|uniref:Nitrogen fixation regulation protein fixK n=1 Tax=Asticcacaulis biprosthecium C19 TaxID=715226 RepID=F4QTH0_9CAUL|nr:helix-turn-helix domain-containing protein [Asticcacaulis biprosthecium]EGF90040.1 nitrogen fixation regulation protein fixK [Asticcacaulis biprosthecium C19]
MFDASPLTQARPLSPRDGDVAHLPALNGPVATFSAGSEIYAQGDRAGTLYQVAFGVVRVYRLLADGRRQICAFHMVGDVFGFEAGIARHVFADAVTTTGLRTIRPSSDADLSRELYRLAMQSLGHAHDHLLTVGRNDAAGRVAAFLLEMADRQGTHGEQTGRAQINLPMSRTDIADYLGLTIETVSRVLTRLKEARILRLTSSRELQVLRWDALEDLTA